MLQVIREIPLDFFSTYLNFLSKNNQGYLSIILVSFAGFTILNRWISPYVSSKCTNAYSRLSANHKIEWDVRVTSTIFSVVVSIICVYILLLEHAITESPLIYDSTLFKTNIAIVMGFIISDLTIMITNYKIIGDVFTLCHHLIALYGYSQSLAYSVMPYFANFRLLSELSTPLVNMRWFFYAAGFKKDSISFFINGILMTMMFFTVRIASIPIFWYKVYTIMDSPMWSKMRHFRYIMIFTCAALDIINTYWFQKMFKGALIVWSANWQYYEKHHKNQQLEMLHDYQRFLRDKIILTNSMLYKSTVNGLSIINPTRLLGNATFDKNVYFSNLIHRLNPNDPIELNAPYTEPHAANTEESSSRKKA